VRLHKGRLDVRRHGMKHAAERSASGLGSLIGAQGISRRKDNEVMT